MERIAERREHLGSHGTALHTVSKRIEKATAGVYWLEAPPASGKSSLGCILACYDGFTYINKQNGHELTTKDLTVFNWLPRRKVFIDEAQLLSRRELALLRSHGTSGSLVICAGVSGAPPPKCSCVKETCDICSVCYKFVCEKTCDKDTPVSSISMAVADSPERRLTIDNLCADPSELQIFVSLFLKHAERDAPRLGSYTVDTAAKELSDVLLERSGGILGLFVAIFKGIFLEHKIFKDKPFDAATLREYTLSPTLFNFVAGTRFTVKLDKEQSKALSQFMAHGKSMPPACSSNQDQCGRRCDNLESTRV